MISRIVVGLLKRLRHPSMRYTPFVRQKEREAVTSQRYDVAVTDEHDPRDLSAS